jgi:hypothetical protein
MSEQAKHTPGPWYVVGSLVSGSTVMFIRGLNDVQIGGVTDTSCDLETQTANARLIAAAPCMLTALIQAERYLDMPAIGETEAGQEIRLARLMTLRAAIAKAGGAA